MFVDDEEAIRASFQARFGSQFDIKTATDGKAALDLLQREHGAINVVVTDIRMPEMSGLELISHSRVIDPDLGFIVVSGHGDTEDIIHAFRLGARNFLRKPYRFADLELAILEEGRHYELARQHRQELAEVRAADKFIAKVEKLTFVLPTRLDWVNPVTLRMVELLLTLGICDEQSRFNVALGLVEILTNAVEHGNLGITSSEKLSLKAKGDRIFQDELRRRMDLDEYRNRKVTLEASIDGKQATFKISDEGAGFKFDDLPDPTDPENLFKPSGRGILLARAFLDDVRYEGVGNSVTLVKNRPRPGNGSA
jgi:FixJ family two-component response regulator